MRKYMRILILQTGAAGHDSADPSSDWWLTDWLEAGLTDWLIDWSLDSATSHFLNYTLEPVYSQHCRCCPLIMFSSSSMWMFSLGLIIFHGYIGEEHVFIPQTPLHLGQCLYSSFTYNAGFTAIPKVFSLNITYCMSQVSFVQIMSPKKVTLIIKICFFSARHSTFPHSPHSLFS